MPVMESVVMLGYLALDMKLFPEADAVTFDMKFVLPDFQVYELVSFGSLEL